MSALFSWDSDEEKLSLQRYEGRPTQPDRPDEKRAWNKFTTWVLPWLRRKRELGDEYLEAEVLDKKAAAFVKYSEAQLNLANAQKVAAETAEIAARLDESKSRRLEVLPASNPAGVDLARLEEMREELDRKFEMLRLIHGGSVKLLENDEAAVQSDLNVPPAGSSNPDHS